MTGYLVLWKRLARRIVTANITKFCRIQASFPVKNMATTDAEAVPDGFVVVPKEPTQELLNKMQDFFVGAFENGLTGGQSIHCAYIAMIEVREQAND